MHGALRSGNRRGWAFRHEQDFEAMADRSDHIIHVVMIDDDMYSAFTTASADKARQAVQMLGDAFGYERVSSWSAVETDLEAFAKVVAVWQEDPRMKPLGGLRIDE